MAHGIEAIVEMLGEVAEFRRNQDKYDGSPKQAKDLYETISGIRDKYSQDLIGKPEEVYVNNLRLSAKQSYESAREKARREHGLKPKNVVSQEDRLDVPIDYLELSLRVQNTFVAEGLDYSGQIAQLTQAELLDLPNFGKKALIEVKSVLKDLGLKTGMRLRNYVPPHERI